MTHPPHITELRTRDRPSALALVDHYTRLFLELRAALPPEQAEAVEAIMCGPFYDGPQPLRRQHKPRKPSIATLIKRAEKSGRPVTSITLPDGTRFAFGEATPTDVVTPLEQWRRRRGQN